MLKTNVPGYDGVVRQGPRRALLWQQLRESTRAEHAQAEGSLAPLAQPDSLARYAALLCVLWGFQAPMERLLNHQDLPPAVDWPARQRLGALTADLVDLGVSGMSLPEAGGLPAVTGPGAVWGTLYVTEGATLGGRVLRRHVEARLGPVPVRFLDGHGDRTQPMWRDLGQAADRYVHSQQDMHLAQHAAIQAFTAFSAWARDAVRARMRQL
jgi:heme oxygenase (biliverdin-IX-beta and delta-forming)